MIDPCLIDLQEHETSAAAAAVAADEAATWLSYCALGANASIALPGGPAAEPFLQMLAVTPIAWNCVTATTIDDCCLPETHPRSKIGNLRRVFAKGYAANAHLVSPCQAGALEQVKLPLDVVVIDLHAESLEPLLTEARDGSASSHIVDLSPVVIRLDAPARHRSWCISTLTSSKRTLLLGSGANVRTELDRALDGQSDSPLTSLLPRLRGAVSIHWSAN